MSEPLKDYELGAKPIQQSTYKGIDARGAASQAAGAPNDRQRLAIAEEKLVALEREYGTLEERFESHVEDTNKAIVRILNEIHGGIE